MATTTKTETHGRSVPVPLPDFLRGFEPEEQVRALLEREWKAVWISPVGSPLSASATAHLQHLAAEIERLRAENAELSNKLAAHEICDGGFVKP